MKFRKIQRSIKLGALSLLGFADALALSFFTAQSASIDCSAPAAPFQQFLPSFLNPFIKLATSINPALLCRIEFVLPLLLQAFLLFGLSGAIATFILTTDLPIFIWKQINQFRAERLIRLLEKANQLIDEIEPTALDSEQLNRMHAAIDALSTP